MGALQTLFAHAVRMQAVTLALSLAAVLLCTSASPLKTEAHFNTDVFTADNTHVTQNSVETAEPAAPKFDTSVFSAAEWTEDAAPVETIPLRRYSSGSGTAGSGVAPPPPPATPPPAKKFTQPITVPLTAAQYTGVQKTVYERGYGVALGIFDTTTNQYKQGCSVSSAVKSRRSVKVEFTATAAGNYAAAAETATTTIKNNPATLATAVANAKTAGGATFANVTVPAANQLTVEAATVEVVSSGASSIAASGCLAVGLAILALRH